MNLCNFLKHDTQKNIKVEFTQEIISRALNWGKRETYNIEWVGWSQSQDSKENLKLESMWFDSAGGIHGSGTDENGYYKISGFTTENSKVGITKHYLGLQSVEYQAQLVNGQNLEGTWQIVSTEDSGTFKLGRKAERWSGWFDKRGKILNIEYYVTYLEDDSLYGFGIEDGRFYVIRGEFLEGNYKFLIEIEREIEQYFIGTIDSASGLLKGTWTNGEELYGNFEFSLGMPDSLDIRMQSYASKGQARGLIV